MLINQFFVKIEIWNVWYVFVYYNNIIIMNLPIFDISNIQNRNYYISFANNNRNNIVNYHCNTSVIKQIQRIYKLNGVDQYNNYPTIYFVESSSTYDSINNYYKSCYGIDYDPITCENMTFLVIQSGTPMQLFIPEDKYTFLEEYKNVNLSINDMNKLNKKIIKFSLYHNQSRLNKNLLKRIKECKNLYFIKWCLKDVYILDFVNELLYYLYLLMHKDHIIDYEYMAEIFSKKFNSIIYGYQMTAVGW